MSDIKIFKRSCDDGFSGIGLDDNVDVRWPREFDHELIHKGLNNDGTIDTKSNRAILQYKVQPKTGKKYAQSNPILSACIDAYEAGIESTGYNIKVKSGMKATPAAIAKKKAEINEMLERVTPTQDYKSFRKTVRRELEQTGNYFIEVNENGFGEVVFLNGIESEFINVVQPTDPVMTTVKASRFGSRVSIRTPLRLRSYVNVDLEGNTTYYSNYYDPVYVDKTTGEFSEERQANSGTRLIHLSVNADHYGVGAPRYLSLLSTLAGVANAIELNNDFLKSGGLPKILLSLIGGDISSDTIETLENYIHGSNRKERAALIKVASTEGNLDESVQAKIQVDKLEQQDDLLFQKYLQDAGALILKAYRLPEALLGVIDANRSSIDGVVGIVESTVFNPERTIVDSIINDTLMKQHFSKYFIQSKPLNIPSKDAVIKALTVVANSKTATAKSMVKQLNETLNINIDSQEPPANDKTDRQSLPINTSHDLGGIQ